MKKNGVGIPANTLRHYFLFDGPARGRVSQTAVELRRADGNPPRAPFMDLGQELWSPDGRRLTILFDPGRIKRDIEATGAAAAPLQAPERYRVRLGPFTHPFRVTPPERRPLDPALWSVAAPRGPRAPVTIRFDRVMDAALLGDQVTLANAQGVPRAARAVVSADDRTLRLWPTAPLRPGRYDVLVSPILEDIAGNRVAAALDHAPATDTTPAAPARPPFTVQDRRAPPD